eukprot:scaffold15234_cov31-Tisochrysis_lutea.AAC.1
MTQAGGLAVDAVGGGEASANAASRRAEDRATTGSGSGVCRCGGQAAGERCLILPPRHAKGFRGVVSEVFTCCNTSSGVTSSNARSTSIRAAPNPWRAPSLGEARPLTSRRTAYARSGQSSPAALPPNWVCAAVSASTSAAAALTLRF